MGAILFVVHGKVQGVGYRQFVLYSARKFGIRGMVCNMPEGSVEILAIGEDKSLEKFSKEIEIDMENGPQVMNVERKVLNLKEKQLQAKIEAYQEFVIEKDGTRFY